MTRLELRGRFFAFPCAVVTPYGSPKAAVTISVSRYSVTSCSLPPARRKTKQYLLLYGFPSVVVLLPRASTTTKSSSAIKRCAVVLILPAILERSTPNNSPSTTCLPIYVLDHFVVPVSVQRKPSSMLSTRGWELPFDSSAKMYCMSCLF